MSVERDLPIVEMLSYRAAVARRMSMEVISMRDSALSFSMGHVYPGPKRQEDRLGDVMADNLGIIGMLDFQKVLARLTDTYIAPAERDYWTY